jgi:amino acid transporter
MKVHFSVVIITLLLSLGGLAAGGHATQENRATPLPQATPSPNLEESLAGLTKAVTNLVDKQAEQGSVSIKFLDFLAALAGAVGAILALVCSIIALRKRAWFEKLVPIIMSIIFAITLATVLLVFFYLFSGVVIALLNVLIALSILLIVGLIAAVHLLTFIDEHPKLKRAILGDFAESPGDTPPSKSSSSADPFCAAPARPGSDGG